MPSPTTSLPDRRRGWRLGAVAALVLLVIYCGWLTAMERVGAPQVRERVVSSTRQAWAVNSSEGLIRGFSDVLTLSAAPGETSAGSIDLLSDPVSSRLLAADPAGRLRALTAGNSRPDQGEIKALMTGVATLDDGRVVLCLGRSGYGTDYIMLVTDPARPAGPEVRIPTGFCTTLMEVKGGDIFYATKQARLVKVSAEGVPAWKTALGQIPTALAVSPLGLVAVGDERGGLTLVTAEGGIIRVMAASQFPLTAVSFLDADTLVAIDGRGQVSVLDGAARLYRRFDLGSGPARIRAILPRPGEVEFVSDTGRVFAVRSIGPLPRLSLPAWTMVKLLGMALLALAAVLLGVAGSADAMAGLKNFGARASTGRAAYLLLLPTFGLLVVFSYYPMATALGYSFGNFSLTAPWEFAGLGNFRAMAEDPYLGQSVVNMLVLLATGLVKMIVLPLLAAELVFWLPSERWQQIFRSAVIFPAVVPGVVLVLVWKMIYDPYSGLLNVSLRALGWEGATHAWLGEERFALASVVFYNFPWINLLIFLIFLGGLVQIDRNLFEAVEMDGASVWQRFRHIDLPALRPKLNVAITLIFIWSVQDFASVLILTGGGPGTATYVPALQMFQQISDGHNLGYSSAIGLGLFLVVVGFTLLLRKLNREDEA